MKIAIYGAGGLGREVLMLVQEINLFKDTFKQITFVVDQPGENKEIMNIPIISFDDFIGFKQYNDFVAIIAVGEPELRRKLYDKLNSNKIQLTQLIHPTVYVSPNTVLEDGVIISKGSYISCNVIIKKNVLVQPNVNIGHDVIIEQNSVISGFTNIGGQSSIGSNSFTGLSSVIKDHIRIGNNSIVSMGAVVFRDVDDNTIVMGNPARTFSNNTEKKVFK